ncbi:hypothetical protein RDWZM_005354 [Blomia tropicalis]|uniref:Uncharacterized protein n=1 Tax=Blomia tropicalis TaxID=40697 RepID=A0A9Q0M8C0_BLOTA|nr:hypothetical protein RDWZM_005354 [Blomia tropicalis]
MGANSLMMGGGPLSPPVTSASTLSPVSNTGLSASALNAAALYSQHRGPLMDLTTSLQHKLFHFSLNAAASTSPSSLSSHSSSSASSAYFSSSSPTSSTKSWSHLDELMLNTAIRGTVDPKSKSSTKSPSGQSISVNSQQSQQAQSHSSQPDPSVVTHSVSHLLNLNDSPSRTNGQSTSDSGIVVLNKSNVIKFGVRQEPNVPVLNGHHNSQPLDLQTYPKSLSSNIGINGNNSNNGLPEIKPILAKVSSNSSLSGTILPVPLSTTTISQAKATVTNSVAGPIGPGSLTNGVPTVPRRRGRPPGSTNKKKKLQQQLQQQQQQLICAMSLIPGANGGPLNAAALSGHPFITSGGLLTPSAGDHFNQFAAAAFAAVSAQSAAAAAAAGGLKSPGPNSNSSNGGRKPRGESRKCRKVYGMDNREMWCTQCKWKKACSRFMD